MNNTTSTLTTTPLIGWLDLSVFGCLLGSSAIIGCYFGCFSGRQNTTKEYLMGGKSMGIFPVSLSLVASFVSGITLLGLPAEVYRYGTQYLAVLLSIQLIGLTIGLVFVPLYSNLGISSCYEYLELRFDKRVRRMASVLFVIYQLTYIPVVLYLPALAFSQVTGVNVHLITPLTCFVCIFYTTLGGLRAVVWSDAVQMALMLATVLTVLFLGVEKEGGWGRVLSRAEEGGRLQMFNFDPDPLQRHTFWTVFIGTYFMFLSECATGQGFVQRYLAVPDLRAARWTLIWFSLGLAAVTGLSGVNGLLIYSAYGDCDPLASGKVQRPDQLLPLFVTEVAGHVPGLTGLFVAGVFSAALSSMSTGLNALFGVLVQDLLSSVLPKQLSTGVYLRLAAILTGAFCVALVYIVEHLGGVLQVTLSMSGITSGTMLGLFLLGIFFPRATGKGALVGAIVSLLLIGCLVGGSQSAIATGALKHQPLSTSVQGCVGNFSLPADTGSMEVWRIFRISYLYYSLIGALLVLLVGAPTSLYLPEQDCERHRDLFSPLVHRFVVAKPAEPVQEMKPLVFSK